MKDYLAKLLADHSEDGLKLYPNYSGRGMFGKKTTGLTGSRCQFELSIFRLTRLLCKLDLIEEGETGESIESEIVLEDIEELIGSYRSDSMGNTDSIFY